MTIDQLTSLTGGFISSLSRLLPGSGHISKHKAIAHPEGDGDNTGYSGFKGVMRCWDILGCSPLSPSLSLTACLRVGTRALEQSAAATASLGGDVARVACSYSRLYDVCGGHLAGGGGDLV